MKIVISDNDHVNLAQEEAVFQKAGMDFTLYQWPAIYIDPPLFSS